MSDDTATYSLKSRVKSQLMGKEVVTGQVVYLLTPPYSYAGY